MKVIKEGKEIVRVMRVTCNKCEAVLEIEAKDLEEINSIMYDETRYSYKCPCCFRPQYLEYKELTEEILYDMYRRNSF